MLGDKFRFRFSKTGTLRLLSHHDLMRCLERMLRRANLPFKSTAGFHPSPRVVFALSLPLGVAGLDEVVEIEFTQTCDSEEVLSKLRSQAPIGLDFQRASIVPMKATAIPRRVVYRVALPDERTSEAMERCTELLASEKIWVDRLKPAPKRLNIRPYLRHLGVCRQEELASSVDVDSEPYGLGNAMLYLDLWVTQTGTARMDEILKLLKLTDLQDAGSVVERATVEIRDEVSNSDSADVPPTGPAESLPLDAAAIAALVGEDEEQSAAVGWSASPASQVVE
jgi:radical SAM-linked protein